MRIELSLPWWSRRLTLTVFAVACLAVWSFAFSPARAEAGSVVIPAWSFARGNVQVHASPDEYAEAGPVVGGGPEEPWGWTVEYDIDVPVSGDYTFQICYASTEARPVEVLFDGRFLARCCIDVTLSSASSEQPATLTCNSSGAKWENACFPGGRVAKQSITKGKHTLKITRKGPLPHLVALRLDTSAEFPEGWKPPQYTVRDLDSVPAEFRNAFSQIAVLPPPIDNSPRPRSAGSLMIPACTFDRGNARIYASPDEDADDQPLLGG